MDRIQMRTNLREYHLHRLLGIEDGIIIGVGDRIRHFPQVLIADTMAGWDVSSPTDVFWDLLSLTTRGKGKLEIPGGGLRELPAGLKESLESLWPERMREIRSSGQIVAMAERTGTGLELDPSKVAIYRGGEFVVRPRDIRIDRQTGLVREVAGPSLNVDPSKVAAFGRVSQIKSLPPELRIVQYGPPGHYEIVARQPMTPEQFQKLVSQTVTH